MTIGVVIDDLHPFFARTVEGIEQRADAAGYHALIAHGSRNAERTAEALSTFSALQVDGAIAVGARGEVSALVKATPSIPLVLVAFEAPASTVDTVNNDESMGSALAVNHLADLGHQRIVHVDGGQGASAAARQAGYATAMKMAGLGAMIEVIPGDYTFEAGQKAAIAIAELPERPTAIFAANDVNALGIMSELHRIGIDVPNEMSIVGYDDIAYGGEAMGGLTTIHQPVRAMGGRAADLLIERLTGERTDVVHAVLSPRLVVRSTTASLT